MGHTTYPILLLLYYTQQPTWRNIDLYLNRVQPKHRSLSSSVISDAHRVSFNLTPTPPTAQQATLPYLQTCTTPSSLSLNSATFYISLSLTVFFSQFCFLINGNFVLWFAQVRPSICATYWNIWMYVWGVCMYQEYLQEWRDSDVAPPPASKGPAGSACYQLSVSEHHPLSTLKRRRPSTLLDWLWYQETEKRALFRSSLFGKLQHWNAAFVPITYAELSRKSWKQKKEARRAHHQRYKAFTKLRDMVQNFATLTNILSPSSSLYSSEF